MSRREFLKRSFAASTVLTLAPAFAARSAHVAGSDEIKIALIGCGGRGTGAAAQALSTTGPVKLWAMADAFADRLQTSLKSLTIGTTGRYDTPANQGFAKRIDVPPARQFVGLDSARRAIESGVDLVVMGQPPGVRPAHFEAAVKAGKHVFMEKPLATDAPGIRRVLAASAEAQKKGLKVGVGLQRHHDPRYCETVKRLQDGAIGKIHFLRVYWNGGPPAKTPISHEGLSELEYQLRNWYFFTWLSGDHNVEQHIHNLDVANWVMQAHPVEAQGLGGRQVRTGKEYGQIFDHHAVEYTYADGVKLFSQSRQMAHCANSVTEYAHGLKGVADLSAATIQAEGQPEWRHPLAARKGRGTRGAGTINPYQIEHDVLFEAVRNNRPHNEVQQGAESTMTAILGRLATYSGQVVKWDEAFHSQVALAPAELTSDTKPPVEPDAEGRYPIALPGTTKVL